jgi:hypothetical protein
MADWPDAGHGSSLAPRLLLLVGLFQTPPLQGAGITYCRMPMPVRVSSGPTFDGGLSVNVTVGTSPLST